MFERIRTRIQNMSTIGRLARGAEAHALRDQQARPGAEHFLLAALDLPDGTARLAFDRAGVSADLLPAAIRDQAAEALRAIGIDAVPPADESDARQGGTGPYRAAPSGRAVMQALAAGRAGHRPLLGAHVVAAVADIPLGIVARSLRSMGLDRAVLRAAADQVIASHHR